MAPCPEITALIEALCKKYGPMYVPYGTSYKEENGTGFRIIDIPAIFSVIYIGNVEHVIYDIQVESYPPGDYIYTAVIELNALLELIERYRVPVGEWPVC